MSEIELPTRLTHEEVTEVPRSPLVLDKIFTGKLKGIAEPSVRDVTRFKGSGVVVNVTNFKEGQDGQEIVILGDGTTTIVHNAAKINTITGVNTLLGAGKVYKFLRLEGKWYEQGGGGTGGGSGEVNTASNVGAGSQVFKSKVGLDLQFRSLTAGSDISIVQSANEIQITGTASLREIPFYNADGTPDHIATVSGGTELPFFNADGTPDNIALI